MLASEGIACARLSTAFQVQAQAIPSEASICHNYQQGTGPDLAHGWTLFAQSAFVPRSIVCGQNQGRV